MDIFTNYSNKTDEQLMVLIQDGDHRAFEKLYERYAHRLNGFFCKMLWSDQEMAEDNVHDIFAKIIDRPELYKEGNDVKPWLFRIAANMCKNAYRKRSFENAYRKQLEEHQITFPSIERKIDENIQSGMLAEALGKLDEDRRTMFLLRYQQDLSLKEIAATFDLPAGTVKSRMFYIKKLLTGAIEDDQNVLKDGK